MLLVHNIKAPLDFDEKTLGDLVAVKLGVDRGRLLSCQVIKKSVDARSKRNIHFVFSVQCQLEAEQDIAQSCDVEKAVPSEVFDCPKHLKSAQRPVVVGTGPAGMLAGLSLAEAGLCPIMLERGRDVDCRKRDVDAFWQSGNLDIVSNVQFGEGGAGTFSDGKLMTGIKKDKYVKKVLEEFIEAGAPKEIMYLAKPHIGTDHLIKVVRNIRHKIESLGGEYRFEHKLSGFICRDDRLVGVEVLKNGNEKIEISCDHVILAIGHSARDTFEMLYNSGVEIEQKPFSVGARIEHKQSMINKSQYGSERVPGLGAADYKLAVHLPNGRSAYTFCMCPGGTVVAAASEKGRVVTNGMSYYARDLENANAALLVGVGERDFASKHPLAGMYFQRKIEEQAFKVAGSNYQAPAQMVGDFLKNKPSRQLGEVRPSYTPGVSVGSIAPLFSDEIVSAMQAAIVEMDKKLRGFASYDAVLTAPETRSSSPIRIVRQADMQSNICGLYPCGEGAGYAGGITSAAADGLKAAEAVIQIICLHQ